jgi:uncharacterized protein involved in type VI secretion and phage assembly
MDSADPRLFGLYPAVVTDVVDPEALGRVEIGLPWLGEAGDDVRAWATLLSPYAEDDAGLHVLPSVDTEVVVGFEAGDAARPYVVGACWNGKESTPFRASRPNDTRVLKSRSGIVLELDDSPGGVKATLRTPAGHTLVLDDGQRQVQLRHADGPAVTVTAGGAVEVRANSTVEVNAVAVNVHAPIATFDGLVKCTTLIADVGVVSPSYTPGAGNVW